MAVRRVTLFQAADGKTFPSLEEAEQHETRSRLYAALDAWLDEDGVYLLDATPSDVVNAVVKRRDDVIALLRGDEPEAG